METKVPDDGRDICGIAGILSRPRESRVRIHTERLYRPRLSAPWAVNCDARGEFPLPSRFYRFYSVERRNVVTSVGFNTHEIDTAKKIDTAIRYARKPSHERGKGPITVPIAIFLQRSFATLFLTLDSMTDLLAPRIVPLERNDRPFVRSDNLKQSESSLEDHSANINFPRLALLIIALTITK